jgi:hypothetical protein
MGLAFHDVLSRGDFHGKAAAKLEAGNESVAKTWNS